MRPALSLEQKAALVAGRAFWSTAEMPDAGIQSVVLTDGPHGVRRQVTGDDHLGIGESAPSTCFPPAAGIASSWNPELVARVGRALGEEARAQHVGVLLGPGINIKRSPLCGRNFEYFSEDPLLSGELGAAWVRGIQSTGVGASVKHFAVNNQETNRMTVSAEVDERTLREIYLPAFERVVTREQPWTVMCSYNRINGVAAAENRWLLTDLLRGEWGFEGLVVSDWGAVDARVPALVAGLDLEMPGPQADSSAAIVSAVQSGGLAESVLDTAVERVVHLADRARRDPAAGEDLNELHPRHHALAREAATESIVLLRNEGGILPLETAQAIAVIGEFARTPRVQGAGSSQVEPTRLDTALETISGIAPVEFAPGYSFDRRVDPAPLIKEAVEVARRSTTVLLFVGLPEGDESEGYDRTHLSLPDSQLALVRAVAAANARTVVVLTNGGVVTLEPWHDSVPAIVEAWLLGQAGGSAVAEVLFGVVEPGGRLAESIPYRLQDTPSYLNFPGENDVVRYGEGVFVGYRYYESVDMPVRYPFGHGLSYTVFALFDLEVSRDGSRASVRVSNTGERVGSHVVQLYVAPPAGEVARPRRELRAFTKVRLEPGASTRVHFELDARAYAHWDTRTSGWVVPGGEYLVEIGHSSHDIALSAAVRRHPPAAGKLTLESRVAEFLEHPVTGPLFARAAKGAEIEGGVNLLDMVASMPMRRLMRFPGVGESFKNLAPLIAIANNPVVRGVAGWLQRRRPH
ncbi:MAG: glycoside hydrolase family 3 C-terminal domain-containing protein [Rhodoglobus sp.]